MATRDLASVSRFVDRVMRLLERAHCCRANTNAEKQAIFRQRYRAYLGEGAIEPNEAELFSDEYDRTPNAQLIGLYVDGRLSASMRIHATTANCRHMPAMWAFSDYLDPELDRGKVIVDPSRFVVDAESSRANPELAYVTARVGWVAGEHYDADLILSTARIEHQAFYRRVFNYRVVCGCRPYATLKKPLSLLFLDYPEQRDRVLLRYPFLRSTASERGMLFESERAPLEAQPWRRPGNHASQPL